MPPFGKRPISRSCGFLKKTVTFVPSFRFWFVVPLPRSHNARCSSSKTIVLPRGVTCAKPSGSTVATRHTLIGKAVLICRSEEHTSELQSPYDLVCRLLLEKKNTKDDYRTEWSESMYR